MGVLTVFLDKITNLADQDTIGKADPYVKFHLEQDNLIFDKDFGRVTSSKKTGDLNPVYEEEFTFEVPGLNNLVLWVKVMDDDPVFDDKMGKCKIDIEELGLGEEPLGIDRVIDNNIFTADGRIFLRLSYTE